MQPPDEGTGSTAGTGVGQGGPGGPEGQGGLSGPNNPGLPDVQEGQGGPGGPSGPGGPDSQVSPGDPDSQSGSSSPQGLGGQCGPGGPSSQRSPGAHDGQGGPGGPHSQGGPGTVEVQGGPAGPGGPREEETMGAAAVSAPHVARTARVSGPGGDAAPLALGPGSRQMVFTLTVPFRSPLEAEMALRSMAPDAQRHQQAAVQKEFTLNGSALAVRWTAEDTGLLRISINSFLDHLSLVMRNIQRIGPPFPLSLGREKGAET
nr:EKC/KEOPS complex subunit LAGE3-like [Microcebus murinus]